MKRMCRCMMKAYKESRARACIFRLFFALPIFCLLRLFHTISRLVTNLAMPTQEASTSTPQLLANCYGVARWLRVYIISIALNLLSTSSNLPPQAPSYPSTRPSPHPLNLQHRLTNLLELLHRPPLQLHRADVLQILPNLNPATSLNLKL